MPGFFEAINRTSPVKEKKHFVNIQGQTVEVSLQKKIEILKHGKENFLLKGNEIEMKPKPKIKIAYPVLKEVEKGYHFIDDDIHWPNDIGEGGKAWLIEYE
jgi:DNA-directed RNA polymerase subunit H (RpoH/RPB5)